MKRRIGRVVGSSVCVATLALAGTALANNSGTPPGSTYGATTGNDHGATITHYNRYYYCQSVNNPGDPSPATPIGWPWVGAIGPNYNC